MMNRHANRAPITLDQKVGDVLKTYPELLDTLVDQSPHFRRLRNPLLRGLHGKLVNLGQAAAIAGIDPVALVRTLNAAVGLAPAEAPPPAPAARKDTPPPAWLEHAPVAVELDVREHQRTGDEPFHAIMAAASAARTGQIFRLRNTFEPVPLYEVLAARGFASWARRLGDEDWEVFFYKEKDETATVTSDTKDEAGAGLDDPWPVEAPTAVVSIDVSELSPPQPMMKILAALEQLGSGEVLLVHHRRRPVHLYAKLAELGYRQKTVEHGPEEVDIYIRKR